MTGHFRPRTKRYGLHATSPEEDSVELELWNRNQEQSPLLRLPPEIRNQIYTYLMTAGQINLHWVPWKHQQRINKGKVYTETVPGGFRSRVLGAEQNPWQQKPGRPTSECITLLSPVCRQLYKETALLPFRLNSWSFDSSHTMERYILREKHFTVLQRRSIQVLFVRGHLTKMMENFLGGLRVVWWDTSLDPTGGRGRPKMQKQVLEIEPYITRRKANMGLMGTFPVG